MLIDFNSLEYLSGVASFRGYDAQGHVETGGAPIWNVVTIDPALGELYLSTGNAGPDLYGGNRKGATLFAVSVVALHMKIGKLAWYYQGVHPDIWDLDSPSTPNPIGDPISRQYAPKRAVGAQPLRYACRRTGQCSKLPHEVRYRSSTLVPSD